jgi:uncharacterized protein
VFDLIGPFLFGLVGSVHCLGMCGPLILAYSLRPDRAGRVRLGKIRSQTSFHTGRLLTYCALGGLAGGLTRIPGLDEFLGGLRGGVAVAGGIVLVFLGLHMVGVIRLPRISTAAPSLVGSRLFARVFSARGPFSGVAVGVVVGFLPCVLTSVMIVKAATTGSVLLGFLTMFLFGLGTVPVLFLTGLSASFLSLKTRLVGQRLAAALVIVMGLVLVLGGGAYFF